MKKWLVLILTLLISSLLLGESVADSTVAEPPQSFNAWLFYERGTGSYERVGLLALEGGLGLEFNEKVRATLYKVMYTESSGMFNAVKYEFIGKGAQIGYVWRHKKLKLSPSIGYEYGSISIGEGNIIEEGIGSNYERDRFEDIYYIPVSLNAQLKFLPVAALSGRIFSRLMQTTPPLVFLWAYVWAKFETISIFGILLRTVLRSLFVQYREN